ncbi:MAG: hypothetical protein SF052_05505 [Bacteroidia bacterium]|nr:hypothetical protein [Bacteroidia bacterium]
MKTVIALGVFLFGVSFANAQVYIEKQTRHRFAQMNFGLDFQRSWSGETSFINSQGTTETMTLPSLQRSRILIGGTHFWGHADFYIAIPVYHPLFEDQEQEISFSSGVETVFKYYPWRIKHHRFRPFLGGSLAPFTYVQNNLNFPDKNGPEITHTSLPLVGGFTFNHKNHLLEISALFNYASRENYFISKGDAVEIQTPPLYISVSWRLMLETTLSAEKDWESGKTEEVTQILAEKKKLNSLFIGAGMSSSWWMGKSRYNQFRNIFIPANGVTVMPDFALGYYFHKPDLNFSFNYRSYRYKSLTYGVNQKSLRRSVGFEATKYLFDYHGFAPFAGPVLTFEDLAFEEKIGNDVLLEIQDQFVGYGITFGWDIRPNRLQSFLLRTNLRYFPQLRLNGNTAETSVNFRNIEFNFIQLIVYPGRMF